MLKLLCLALVIFAFSGVAPSQQKVADFAGIWEAKFHDKVFCVLTLAGDAKLTGAILPPHQIRVTEEGDLLQAEPSETNESFQLLNIISDGDSLTFEFKIDDDIEKLKLTVTDHNHAELRFVDAPMKPIQLQRH